MKTMMTLAAALAASTATAQITSEDDAIFGVDSITRDAAQQLDFLDLTLSTNRSFNDVSTQFGAGGDFEGWRHATLAELSGLINATGFSPSFTPDTGFASSPAGTDYLSELVTSVGTTFTNSSLRSAAGIVSDLVEPGRNYSIDLVDLTDNSTSGDRVNRGSLLSANSSNVGHWLVRPVPAPSTAIVLGVAGLAATRRRR